MSTNKKRRSLLDVMLAGSAAILCLWMIITSGIVFAETPHRHGARSELSQAITNCVTSGPPSGEYTVNICLPYANNNSTVTGSVSITGLLDITGSSPGVRSLVFYLGDEYLLTDFEAPYTFELPTDYFVDGTYRLSATALMRDAFVTDPAVITLNFHNGIASLPVNTNTFTPASGRPSGPGEPFIVVVAGDGAGGERTSEQVVDLIASWNPNMFLYLGDVYERGTYTEFFNWYGDETRLFGQFRDITNPTIGNHEYNSGGKASGYFFYWDNIPNYYSFDAAGWHFISLNSTGQFRQTATDTQQFGWLWQDLRSSTAQCTIAFLQDPVYSLGPHGDIDRLNSIWYTLVQNGVEVVLAGNDHNYQRWHPLDSYGRLDPTGTTLFVVGTGGHAIRGFNRTDERVAVGYDATSEKPVFGALNLRLNAHGLEYHFVNIAGELLDFGVIGCEAAASDTTPPLPPSNLTSEISVAGHVILKWMEATDDTGVSGYTIYRNGVALTTVRGPTSGYTDTSTKLGTAYSYTLQAFDLSNNQSVLSKSVVATTQPTATLTLIPVADSYVDLSTPDMNFGKRSRLRTDTTPTVKSYIRFDIPELPGAVVSATLRVYTNSTSRTGHDVYEVSLSEWDELGITYNNAPPLGRLIGSSAAFESDTWVSVDVTSLIQSERPLSLALVTTNNTNTSYSSREGANPAEIIIELGSDTPSDASG